MTHVDIFTKIQSWSFRICSKFCQQKNQPFCTWFDESPRLYSSDTRLRLNDWMTKRLTVSVSGKTYIDIICKWNQTPYTMHPWIHDQSHFDTWYQDNVMAWKCFPRYCPFVRGIHRFPLIPLTKDQKCETLTSLQYQYNHKRAALR